MADEIARLGIEVNSKDIKEAIRRLDKLEEQSGKAEKKTKKLGKAFSGLGAAVAGVGIIAFSKKIIDATIEQERAIAQLEAAIKSTGGAAGLTSTELQKMASDLQAVTTYGDEATIKMQSVLLTFTKIGKETFPQASAAILDMATRLGTDLNSAAIQVGKALNDPVAGITALTRSGIQFTESQKDLIKSLSDSGDMVGAQTIILKELETQFGGSAKAARETLGGAMEALGNAFGDLLESDSMGGATTAIESLTKTINDPIVAEGLGNLTSGVITLVEWAAKGAAAFADLGKSIGEALAQEIYGKIPDDAAMAAQAFETAQFRAKGYEEELARLKSQIDESAAALQILTENGLKPGDAAFDVHAEKLQKIGAEYQLVNERLNEVKANLQTMPTQVAQGQDDKPDTQAVSSLGFSENDFEDDIDFMMRQNEALRADKDEKLQIEMDYWDRLFNIQTGSQKASIEFSKAIQSKDLKGAISHGALMLSNASKQSRALFEVQKAFALANAAVTLPDAILQSFRNGGGYPFGLIPAGLMAAQGAAQISAINSASFGGGGGKPSVGGGGGSASSSSVPGLPSGATATPQGLEQPEQQSKQVNFVFEGDGPNTEAARRTAETVIDTLRGMGYDIQATIS